MKKPKEYYRIVHDWLHKHYGKPNKCENTECDGKGKRFEYALKHGFEHERNINNYIQLCSKCHRRYDWTPEKEKAERYACSCNTRPNWENWKNFPTQPPICTGDDGFSSESLRQFIREDTDGLLTEKEIDKILSEANSKWRKEVIKAGGNAVVPQVVMQIFKAREQYENHENSSTI